ncbi:MAG: hypothetical protein ABIU30_07705 [Ferruginibacter sp.]
MKKNVQDNNQKPIDVCPARTTAAMLLMMKITTSCPNIAKPHVRRMCFFSCQPVYAILFLVLAASRPNVSQAMPLGVNTNNNKLEMFCRDFVCKYFDMLLLVSFGRGLQARKRLFHLGVSQLLHQYFLHLLNCLKVAFS